MNPPNRLIVALDRSDRDEILTLADSLQGIAGTIKVGLQAFVANGPSIVRELVSRGHGVFLDLKLHDIPNTVARSVSEVKTLGAAMLTIHAAGGTAMMNAAREETRESGPVLLAVTVLTSLGASDLAGIGMAGSAEENALRLAALAKACGVPGVVASPQEIRPIRERCGADLIIVTPGIRGPGDPAADQKRTMSPAEAVRAGADYIVVGRPITEAADPRAAASRILASIG